MQVKPDALWGGWGEAGERERRGGKTGRSFPGAYSHHDTGTVNHRRKFLYVNSINFLN